MWITNLTRAKIGLHFGGDALNDGGLSRGRDFRPHHFRRKAEAVAHGSVLRILLRYRTPHIIFRQGKPADRKIDDLAFRRSTKIKRPMIYRRKKLRADLMFERKRGNRPASPVALRAERPGL